MRERGETLERTLRKDIVVSQVRDVSLNRVATLGNEKVTDDESFR